MIMKSEDHTGAEEGDYCSTWMSTTMDPILHQSSSSCNAGRAHHHHHLDKKRRFSEEQIKSLESMFETQSKLEPRQKLHLARELGLQPRQVAIWFQNKRARWKSKQLERQYSSLRKDYDALLDSFEFLKREKQLLLKQLQSLAELLEESREKMTKTENRPEDATGRSKDDKMLHLSEEEQDLHDGRIGSTLSSTAPDQEEQEQEQQLYLQSPWPALEESSTSSQWWEFWPINE